MEKTFTLSICYAHGTGNNYKFKMQSNGDGTFRILTKVSGYARCADGQSGSSTNYDDGGIIRQTTYSSSDTSQRWYFYPVEQDDDTVIETSATYTANKNFTKTVTDAAGGVTTYFNNTASGVLTSVRDPLSNVTSYTYDKSNRVTQTTGPVMSGNAAQSYVKYSYSQDRLTQIDANGLVQYNFAYDKFGRSTSVSVGNGSSSRTLASYSYNAKSLPEKITYGNGTVKTNTYNSLDKLTAVSYNGSNTRKAEYYYGSDGNLAQVVDRSANVRRLPVYDLSDRLVSVKEFSGASLESRNVRSSVDYTYADKTNYITHKRYSLPQENTVISSTFSYGNASSGQMPDAVYSIQSASTLKRTYEYDSLGRRTQENVYSGDKLLFKNAISFTSSSVEADDDLSRSTNLVRMYSTKTGWYGYSYDANGNISSMLFNKTGGSMNGVWYYYDGLNRLTRVNDRIVGKTYSYSYDANGNITSKTECDYTTGDIPSDAAKVTYTYDSAWKDLLVQYGSKSITYDAIGNPTRIGNSTLTWTGRQLDSYSDGTKNCNFTYDINGQRYKKTVNGTTTEYYYGDGKLFAQKTGGRVLLFRYDENDLPIGVTVRENSTRKNYFYVKNVQGDITAIVDSTGNIVAEYSYDVWGKIIGMTDTSDTGIGTDNPLRYRGYYYDTETQLYYVSSRYYDPEIGRFINADDTEYLGADGSVLSYNLFAYCMNNPVNRFDVDGNWSLPNWAKITIGVVALAGAVALTVATGGGAAVVAVGIAKIVGSVALSTAVSAGVGYLNNGKQGAIDGACNGFMFGSLSACGGAALKYAKVRAAITGSPNSIGQAGERLAGIDRSAKQPINVNGRVRIPDAMTDSVLKEVKNVKYISNTQQLRDFETYAKATGRTLELWVRPTTKIAKTVISAGWDIRYLW